jgi:hypothetical protein
MFGWLFSRKARAGAPVAGRQRQASDRRRPPGLSTKLADQEDKWNAIAETIRFIVAVYVQGEETVVDVLRVRGAYLNDRHTLVLEVAAPKAVKDWDAGDRLEWVRDFELPIDALRHFQPLHAAFWRDGTQAYRRAVENRRAASEDL